MSFPLLNDLPRIPHPFLIKLFTLNVSPHYFHLTYNLHGPPFLCPLSSSMASTEMQEKRLEKRLEFASERECIYSLYHPTPCTHLQLYPLPCHPQLGDISKCACATGPCPFICGWTSRSIPFLSYSEQRRTEHGGKCLPWGVRPSMV